MAIIKLFIFFLSFIMPGYFLLSLILRQEKISSWLKLALSYGLGAFFITGQLFLYFFIFRLSFSPWLYCVFAIETLLLFSFAYKRVGLAGDFKFDFAFFKKLKIKEMALIALIAIQAVFMLCGALSRPTIAYDSVAMWSFKAKILYYENKIDFNPGSSLYLGGGAHINYPWHAPLAQYWLFNILGEYNDLLNNLIFSFYYLALLAVCYYSLRNYCERFFSLLFTFFLSSMPLVFYHSFNAYADLSLGFYVFVSFVFLYGWLTKQDDKYLLLSGIFAGISLFVKTEAIIYFIAGLAALLLFLSLGREKEKIKKLSRYFAPAALIISPWALFIVSHNLSVSNVKAGLGFHPEALKNVFNAMFINNNWNIWWYAVLAILAMDIKKIIKERALLSGWVFLSLSLAGFIILYLFTEEYQYAADYTAVGRNILTAAPVSVFIAAISLRLNS